MNQVAPAASFWRRHARAILGAALLLLAIHDVLGPHGFLAMRRTQKEMEQLRGEVQRLRLLDFLALATDDGTRSLAETISRHGDGWRGRGGMVVITPNRSSDWVEALVDSATRGQRHLCIFVAPTSFGAKGQALRIPAAWRLALDWWVVRRGDVLGSGERTSAAG